LWCRRVSDSGEVEGKLFVAVVGSPEIEGDGGELVDDGNSEAILGHVDGLEVMVTGFAGVDADVRDLLGREDWERLEAVFATGRADDPRKTPFIHA